MTDANKLIARRFFEELYSKCELELVDELIAEEYVAHGPGSELNTLESPGAYAQGREAVRASLSAKPPDIDVVVEDQIAEGELVVSRLRFSSGGERWSGVAIQRIEDGKIAETWRITNRRAG